MGVLLYHLDSVGIFGGFLAMAAFFRGAPRNGKQVPLVGAAVTSLDLIKFSVRAREDYIFSCHQVGGQTLNSALFRPGQGHAPVANTTQARQLVDGAVAAFEAGSRMSAHEISRNAHHEVFLLDAGNRIFPNHIPLWLFVPADKAIRLLVLRAVFVGMRSKGTAQAIASLDLLGAILRRKVNALLAKAFFLWDEIA